MIEGYCVVGEFGFDIVIIKSVSFGSMTTVGVEKPNELEWTIKEKKKLLMSKSKAEKLLNKIKASEFSKIFDTRLWIKKAVIDDRNNLNVEYTKIC